MFSKHSGLDDVLMDKIEEFLITGIKYSFGLFVIGQSVIGIISML